MTWATFYLICFVVGFVFSLLSVAGGLGHLRLPGHLHLPHIGHHVGGIHTPSIGHHAGGIHAPTAGAHGASGAPGHLRGGAGPHVSFFNFFTLMAFLAWFGGTGYLLTQYSSIWYLLGLALATASGLAGASVVFWFLAKVLLGHEKPLDAADYNMVGVLGRVSSSIREAGTGEIIFSQQGVRRTSGARSEDGTRIDKGTEVVITRYERGIAYVRRWEDFAQ